MPIRERAAAVLVAASLSAAAPAAWAHSEHTVLYVAPDGRDAGDCRNPDAPCASLLYALARAGKGGQLRVAAGTYELERAEGILLVGDMIDVRGGYSTRDRFAVRDAAANQTYVVGPAYEYRERMAARGLILVQDQKSMGLEQASGDVAEVDENAPTSATCAGGVAGAFPCQGIDLLRWMRLSDFSSNPSAANDVWGFVDRNNAREYAIIGLRNGTAVVDITRPTRPREVGTIPGPSTSWRDIKVYQRFDAQAHRWHAYAYGVADATSQGLQVIDLGGLPRSIALAATYTGFSSAHNIYISNVDYASGVALPGMHPYVYIMGSNVSSGAFRILELSDPVRPVLATAPPPGTQYVHDGTTMILRGARAADCAAGHDPCELFLDFNENTLDLWDMTDKGAPQRLASMRYDGTGYTHSGWYAEDTLHVFLQDELDEANFGTNTRLRTVDISTLAAPFVSSVWVGPSQAIDHNGYVKGMRYYMSNYRRGLTILDITDPNGPKERAYFDTYPSNDSAFFNGAWGVYAFLPSGNIVVSDIERGLFVLREQ